MSIIWTNTSHDFETHCYLLFEPVYSPHDFCPINIIKAKPNYILFIFVSSLVGEIHSKYVSALIFS